MKLQKFLYTLSVLFMLPMVLFCIMGLFNVNVTPQQFSSAGILIFMGTFLAGITSFIEEK